MNKKLTSIVCYITFIGWLIAFLLGDKENAKFHLNQGLTLAVIQLAATLFGGVLCAIPVVGGLISILFWVLDIACLILAVLGIFNVLEEKEAELPFVGKFNFLGYILK